MNRTASDSRFQHSSFCQEFCDIDIDAPTVCHKFPSTVSYIFQWHFSTCAIQIARQFIFRLCKCIHLASSASLARRDDRGCLSVDWRVNRRSWLLCRSFSASSWSPFRKAQYILAGGRSSQDALYGKIMSDLTKEFSFSSSAALSSVNIIVHFFASFHRIAFN